MKKLYAMLAIVGVLSAGSWRMHADDSDIFGRNIQPNVLILIDSSGSMADEVPSTVYDAATTYPVQNRCRVGSSNNQPCTSAVVWRYTSSNNRYTQYAANIASVSSSSARNALSTTGYWSGTISGSSVELYVGNYLNYYLAPSYTEEPKIDIAKRVLTDLVNSVENVRFGVMKFNNSSTGASMVATMGTATATMVTAINNISVNGTTPTGEQLRDAGNYYKGTFSSYASPIQMSCQPNFVILMSDGDWNGSINPATEGHNRFIQDHATAAGFPGTQNVIVHTIGFGAGLSGDGLDSLRDTATNGGGTFFTAQSSTQLEDVLQEAIRQIVAATFTFASPVVPTTSVTGSNKIYTAAFRTDAVRPFWQGFLKAFQRDANGQIAVDADGVPLAANLVWEAGQKLTETLSGNRTIYTVLSGSVATFNTSNASITNAMLGAANSTERDNIIRFTRGVDVYDDDLDSNTTEERPWKLGDIFHANPVLVSPPLLPLTDSTYQTFKTTNASRTTIVLAAANDGMIHAFRESDGVELWALILPDALSRLKNLTSHSAPHDFFYDASPIATDIKISGTWKTIVVFGQRRGGENYYAIDVTNTTSPAYLWSFTDARMGETWSDPAIGKIKMSDGTDKTVAFIGGGYDTAQNNSSGKAFFIIDLATGAKLWEYYNSTSANDRNYMNFSLASSPAAADVNGDGYVDRVYIGDVGGQLWKFDTSAAATVSSGLITNYTGKRLFAASPSQTNPPTVGEYYPAQAIYATPSLSLDDASNLWVYFGTGDRNHPNNTGTNRFYGIKDNTNMTNGSTLTEASLINVTSTYGTAIQGWYFTLNADEKVLAAANVFNQVVFFSTFTPMDTATCSGGGGTARLCGVAMLTGYAGVNWGSGTAVTASAGSAGSALGTAHSARFTTVGTGIAAKPVVVISQTGATVTSSVIAATTDQQLLSNPAPPPSLKRILYWRQRP